MVFQTGRGTLVQVRRIRAIGMLPVATIAGFGLVAGVALAGCSSFPVRSGASAPASASPTGDTASPSHLTPTSTRSDTPTPEPPPAPTIDTNLAPPKVDGVTWQPVGTPVGGHPAAYLSEADGGQIALMWMDPKLLGFRFIPGYEVPGSGPRTAADKDPNSWVPNMVAAFNGGFQLSDGAGGYYYLGETVKEMQDGLGTVVIYKDGTMKVGSYGRDVTVGPDVVAVRQNLQPLIDNGQSQASPDDSSRRWGIADKGSSYAKRSAVGQLADGSIVFGYGSGITASQLADAMVAVGVQQAVALDMNISWPTGYYYTREGGEVVGHRIQPDIVREPDTYLDSFKKDFFVAESRVPLSPGAASPTPSKS